MDRPAHEPSPPAPGRLRRGLLRIALLVASAALALALAEAAVRVAGLHVPPRGDAGAQSMVRPVPEDVAPGVRFELRPGWTGTTRYPGAGDAPAREVVYTVNQEGFRGRAVTPRKPEGTFRVVALGDSFTYGTGVGDEETWPFLLEAELRERLGRAIEVLNFGVPAYNTRQEVAQLHQRAALYQPDLVVLCAYVNDASGEDRDAAPDEERPWEVRLVQALGLTSGRWDDGAPMTPAQRRTMALRERSRLADLGAHALHARLMGRVTARNYARDWAEGSPGLAMVKSALSAAVVIARRERFDLVAFSYPDLPSLGDEYAFAAQHATFARLCAELGIPHRDLVDAFDGLDPDALIAHAHDKHPNAAANRVAAAALADFLAPRIAGG